MSSVHGVPETSTPHYFHRRRSPLEMLAILPTMLLTAAMFLGSTGGCSVVTGVTTTFYGAPDNDPPGPATAYDCGGRNYIAGGTGTHADPLTFASAPGEYDTCKSSRPSLSLFPLPPFSSTLSPPPPPSKHSPELIDPDQARLSISLISRSIFAWRTTARSARPTTTPAPSTSMFGRARLLAAARRRSIARMR